MSAANRDDVWKIIGYIQDDLRQTQGKLVQLRSMLAAGALDRAPATTHKCPDCGREVQGDQALVEHRYDAHNIGSLCLDCGRAFDSDHNCPTKAAA